MRITLQIQRVLRVLLDSDERYGLRICGDTQLPAGTVYPILARLERAGLVESFWEDPTRHQAEGRPRRRYYRLTPDGTQFAKAAIEVTYRAGRRVQADTGSA